MATFTITITTTGSGTATFPAGVTEASPVEVWGPGGIGTTAGGGGGGAFSAKSNVAVTSSVSYVVGATGTDSYWGNATTVMAKAGASGATRTGGQASASVGTTKFSGGDGATSANGGGGGGSASPTANGVTATTGAGGASGSGAAGGAAGQNSGTSNVEGGGGGGGNSSGFGGFAGQPGGGEGYGSFGSLGSVVPRGQIRYTYFDPGFSATAPAPSSTVGNTSTNGGSAGTNATGTKLVSLFTVPSGINITQLVANIGAGSGSAQAIIHDNSASSPGALLGNSAVQSVGVGLNTFTFNPPVTITNTTVYLGLIVNSTVALGVRNGTQYLQLNDTFSDGPSNPFGGGYSTNNGQDVSVSAVYYIPGTALQITGNQGVFNPVYPANTVLPVITGNAITGQLLASSTGTWTGSPSSFAYQWNNNTVAIPGATSSTYSPVGSDINDTLSVTVSATNANGTVSATSNATSSVTAGPITIVLTAGTSSLTIPSDCDGNAVIHALGPGGKGNGSATSARHGGGGGGAYGTKALTGLNPGDIVSLSIPTGGTQATVWFNSSSFFAVDYGRNGSTSTTAGGAGGLAANCLGTDTASNGGSGATSGSTTGGGGGGGAAGPGGAGKNGGNGGTTGSGGGGGANGGSSTAGSAATTTTNAAGGQGPGGTGAGAANGDATANSGAGGGGSNTNGAGDGATYSVWTASTTGVTYGPGGGGGGGRQAASGGSTGANYGGGSGGQNQATAAVSGDALIVFIYTPVAPSGPVTINGTIAVTNGPDTMAATGNVVVTGSIAATDGADIMSANGTVFTMPAVYVGTSVFPSSTGSFTITKPTGTAAGDFMMVFCPYGGTVTSPGGSWTHDTRTWVYGYDIHCYTRLLTAADISGSISITGVSYAPVTAVVYRGATSAVLMGYAESAGTDSTLVLPRSARSNSSVGQVSWISDRSGDGSPVAPTGFLARTGPNATGVFTASIADCIDGTQPSGSGSDTWTGVSTTSSYTQVGFNYELEFVISTGSINVTNGPDTMSANGKVLVSGVMAATDGADILSASGTVLVSGSLNATNGSDVMSANGIVRDTVVIGTIAAVNGPDIMTAFGQVTGGVPVIGTIAAVNSSDIMQANGIVRDTTVFAAINAFNGPDVIEATGTVVVTGAIAANDGAPIISATGFLTGWLNLQPNDETWTQQSASSEDWTPQDPANEAWEPQQPAEEDWLPQSANSKDWSR